MCLTVLKNTLFLLFLLLHINHHNLLLKKSSSKIVSSVALSGNISKGNCCFELADIDVFHNFLVALSFRHYKEIIPVCWKPLTSHWVKTNTDGSLVGTFASCGGLFRDHLGTYLGGFAANLGDVSVFEAEVTGLIAALEFAASHGWDGIWLESDSTSAVHAFRNPSAISFHLRNWWHNCSLLGITLICSHAFRAGN